MCEVIWLLWVTFGICGLVASLAFTCIFINEGNKHGLSDDERKYLRFAVLGIPASLALPLTVVLVVPVATLWGLLWMGKGIGKHWLAS